MSPAGPAAGTAVEEDAPAKLNLYLHVLGRRADGYHELDSLFAFADIADHLVAAPAPGFELLVDGPFATALEGEADNLVLRAARALAAAAGVTAGARLRLTKNLPVAAGLGGGSADAAAALRALVRLWGLDFGAERLRALALPLGADIPACLFARPCFVGGIGEQIEPAPPLPALGVVLVNPLRPLPTGRVFAGLGGRYSSAARFADLPSDGEAFTALLAQRRNDLAVPAVALEPAVGQVLGALGATAGCRLARLSGSGATCFGLFAHRPAAVAAADALRSRHPEWWVASGGLIDRGPFSS